MIADQDSGRLPAREMLKDGVSCLAWLVVIESAQLVVAALYLINHWR